MSKETETNLEDEWEAVLLSMSEAEFAKFMTWLWSKETE